MGIPVPEERPLAFITCASRASKALRPLIEAAESLLLDAGWRTRLPRRVTPRQGTPLDERRRLRLDSYRDVENARLVLHVPAPASLAGLKHHRELQRAVRLGLPTALLVCLDERDRLGVGRPEPARIQCLLDSTGGAVIGNLSELAAMVHRIHRSRPEMALPR